jgi:hypothetical protein
MTWADFYLACFAVGFAFSLLSLLMGGVPWHLPHGVGGAHGHMGSAAPQAGQGGPLRSGGVRGGSVSPLNPVTLAAFLAWFGGTGYLLTRYSTLWLFVALGVAMASGLAGASIVFLFLSKVLTAEDENLDPADFEMVGVLGRVSSSIRKGGTGEIIYSQAGTRRTCGARAEDGSVIAKGEEVVVTRYEKGIGYVRRWDDMTGEERPDKEKRDEETTGQV